MNTLLQDLRYGLRMLWKSPGFAAVAVVTLALGIGANTAIFSTLDALLLHPFNLRDTDRLTAVFETRAQDAGTHDSVAFANYLDMRAQSGAFEGAAAWTNSNANLSEGEQPERIEGIAASPQLFSVLGVQPALGRAFQPEE